MKQILLSAAGTPARPGTSAILLSDILRDCLLARARSRERLGPRRALVGVARVAEQRGERVGLDRMLPVSDEDEPAAVRLDEPSGLLPHALADGVAERRQHGGVLRIERDDEEVDRPFEVHELIAIEEDRREVDVLLLGDPQRRLVGAFLAAPAPARRM